MSLLTQLGIESPSKLRKDFERIYPFPPVSAVEDRENWIRDYEARSARTLHDGVSRLVSTDPILNALAEEMHSEFARTPRRGRRG